MISVHPPDRAEPAIDLEQEGEVDYLAKKYGVTSQRVREVARLVGPTYTAIEEELTRTDPHASD